MTRHIAAVLFALTLAFINATAANAGSLTPPGKPDSTMRSLEQVKPTWDKIIPTAQRFVDALDGTAVLDKETGLVWAKTPDSTTRSLQQAMDYCTTLYLGGRLGWRLPTVEELGSLIDRSNTGNIKLPVGHPFLNVQSGTYWTSSSYTGNAGYAWAVKVFDGYLINYNGSLYVWPVRSGQ